MNNKTIEALIIIGRCVETGALLAVIPLIRSQRANRVIVEYAFNGVSDYCSAVLHPDLYMHLDKFSSLSNQLLEAIGDHDVLYIEPVRQSDLALWEKLLETAPEKLAFDSHAVRFGEHYSQWRTENLGAKKRSQLDRKMRRLAETGTVNLRLLPTEETASALTWASRYRKGRFPHDPIQQEVVLDFYKEVAETGAKSGFARTYMLTCNGAPVALCFGLVNSNSYHYLVLACDYDRYGRFSPGIMILDSAMSDWATEGGTVFDFTIGDEPFKTTFRCKRTSMFKFTRVNSHMSNNHLEFARN
ncbi:MAG: GNAT family N-acetyltransferase [Methylococcales bacterium]